MILLAVLLFTLAACGGKNANTSESQKNDNTSATTVTNANTGSDQPSWKSDNSPFSIEWYVDLSWWKWNGSEWGKDLTSSIIKEKTGANISFLVPAGDDGQQLSTMVASDSLPDVITIEAWWNTRNRALTNKLATEGVILAYNDLIDQYAPTMKNVIRQDVFNWYAEADGKTYLLPNYAYSNQDLAPGEQLIPNGCFTVRKDLLEAIGNPDISTPEGLLAACQKIKEEVKEYKGQSIIPIQLYEGVGNSILWLSQYFATPYEDASGNYLYDFLQPQYKEALKFLNTAYRQGLISDANFSDTRDLVNEKIASGRVFAMFTAPQDFTQQLQTLYQSDNNAVYVPFVLRNSAGQDPVLQDIRGMGWLTTAITKNAKKPDRIIKLFEYLLSDEGLIDTQFGKEGVTFDWNSDKTKITLRKEAVEDIANGGKQYAIGSFMMLDNYARRRVWEDTSSADPMTKATVDTYIKVPMAKYSYDYTAAGLKVDPTDPRVEKMQDVSTKIANARQKNIARIIVSKTDDEFEKNYQAAIDELKELGLDELIQYNNDAFQRAKQSLGIKYSWPLLQ